MSDHRISISATDIPGLYDVLVGERWFRDLTTGQVCDLLRREGFDPASIVMAPR